MADVNGKYVQEKAENVDAYMEAIGVPWLIRKTAANITPSLEISRDGETWKISFKTAIKSNNSTFKVGQDFEEESPNGKKVKGKAIFENDKLTITTYPEIGELRRELAFTGDKIEMTMVAVAKNVVGKRIFRKA